MTDATSRDRARSALERLTDTGGLRIGIVGDFMLDRYVWGDTERISPEAPVPVIDQESESERLGGAGNVAANLAALDVEPVPIGAVGEDAPGDSVRRLLQSLECSLDGLLTTKNRPTTVKTRIVSRGQQVARVDHEVRAELSGDLVARLERMADSVAAAVDGWLVSDYEKGACVPELVSSVIARAREHDQPIFVDPKGTDYSAYGSATCVLPNRHELEQALGVSRLSGDRTIVRAARRLMDEHDFSSVVVTRGNEGMSVVDSDGEWHVRSTAREVYDVSGAGDCVVATICCAVTAGANLRPAAELANAAAGQVVAKVGTAPLSRAELKRAFHVRGAAGLNEKILDGEQLNDQLHRWRNQEVKVVFTNGCFDLLHLGHVSLLERAAELGDVLIVAINSDDSVRRLKGPDRPLSREEDRALVLAGLSAVDAVVVFDEDTPRELISTVRPDVLVKGADYEPDEVVGREIVEEEGGEIVLLPLVEGYSTTRLVERISTSSGRS